MTHASLGRVSVSPWLYGVVVPVHRLFLSLYFRQIEIQGFEHLPVNGPVVLAPKHFSRWDPLVLALLSLEPFWFMANANQFEGVQGWFLRRLGAFPIDLNTPQIASFRMAVDLLRMGKKMMLFPEGGIVRDQVLRPIKPGLARLVLQAESLMQPTQIPVVPIAIHYTPTAIWRAKVTVSICPPLYAAHYRQGDNKQTAIAFTDAVEKTLVKELERLVMPQ